MSNTIDQVRDLDAVKTLRPLAFGLTGRFVQGADAILRRVLCQWRRAGLLELEGQTLDRVARRALARQAERLAEQVSFVVSCTVVLTQDEASGDATYAARVRLEDETTRALEVVASAARPIVLQLGGQAE